MTENSNIRDGHFMGKMLTAVSYFVFVGPIMVEYLLI